MYVDSSSITVNHKTYTRHLLRTSFRKDGKVKHRTIANISSCSDEEIQAVKLGRNCLPLWVDQGDGGVVGSTKD